jgi:hypothetical protein
VAGLATDRVVALAALTIVVAGEIGILMGGALARGRGACEVARVVAESNSAVPETADSCSLTSSSGSVRTAVPTPKRSKRGGHRVHDYLSGKRPMTEGSSCGTARREEAARSSRCPQSGRSTWRSTATSHRCADASWPPPRFEPTRVVGCRTNLTSVASQAAAGRVRVLGRTGRELRRFCRRWLRRRFSSDRAVSRSGSPQPLFGRVSLAL